MSNYIGIDYSGFTRVNRDENGFRFGVIAQNSLNPDAMEDIFQNSRDLTHEAAVEDAKHRIVQCLDLNTDEERRSALRKCLDDFVRTDSRLDERVNDILELHEDPRFIDREQAWQVVEQDFDDGYECDDHDWLYEKDGYKLSKCLITDIFVLKSPFYTYAGYCSPCCPGAGNLDSPFEGESAPKGDCKGYGEMFQSAAEDAGFPKVLCLGHDYFENGEAPYKVFSVATGKRVVMVEKPVQCPSCKGTGIWAATGVVCGNCQGTKSVIDKVAEEQ